MKEIELKELFENADQYKDCEITVKGWIRTNRDSNKFGFIELNDGTAFKSLQIVYEENVIENFGNIAKVPIPSALMVRGDFVLTPEAKQPFEIKAKSIVVEAPSSSDFPLQKKRHTFEYLRTIAHLRPRSNAFSAVFRVRSVDA